MRGCVVNMVLHYVSDQEVLETVTYVAGNPVSLTGDMTSLGTFANVPAFSSVLWQVVRYMLSQCSYGSSHVWL